MLLRKRDEKSKLVFLLPSRPPPTLTLTAVCPGHRHAGGLLPQSLPRLGVLPPQAAPDSDPEAQRGAPGAGRVRGPAEEAGALHGHHHPEHRRPPRASWLQTRPQHPR